MKDIPEDLLELINKRISEGWRFRKWDEETILMPPKGDKREHWFKKKI